jgi:hypothetical protein
MQPPPLSIALGSFVALLVATAGYVLTREAGTDDDPADASERLGLIERDDDAVDEPEIPPLPFADDAGDLYGATARRGITRERIALGSGPIDPAAIAGRDGCLAVRVDRDTEGCLPVYAPSPGERAVSTVRFDAAQATFEWPLPAQHEQCQEHLVARKSSEHRAFDELQNGAHCIVDGIVERDRPELEEVRIALGAGATGNALVELIDLIREHLERRDVHPDLVHIVVATAS